VSSMISRRKLLAFTGRFGAQAFLYSLFLGKAFAQGTDKGRGLFTLGVASGDPFPDGVVLWTRLAPDPLSTRGGMDHAPVNVDWEIAKDQNMSKIVQRGTKIAHRDLGHSVHVEVEGLEANQHYWYRFRVGPDTSPIGRTQTAPGAGSVEGGVKFAVASCQHYEQGYYTAHRHMANEDLHFVLFLGDYIYERKTSKMRHRFHSNFEATSLDEYRERYAQYKTDPDLQACHAAFPWIVTWDDHEVDNNYAGAIGLKQDDRTVFLERRAAAYQAYYENMPLRRSAQPKGADMALYRRFKFGDLLEISVLDTRQFRSPQPCAGKWLVCDGAEDPKATMLGDTQESWLFGGLQKSKARWNVIAQQVPIFQRLHHKDDGGRRINPDKWDGYGVARQRLMNFLFHKKISNPIVLSGDVHANWVSNLKLDFDDSDSAIVGSEFVATSISSGGNGKRGKKAAKKWIAKNLHIKFHNKKRGYLRCDVTKDIWKTELREVAYVDEKGAPIKTRASFEVKHNVAGVRAL
jgi:alkaline phosphatase D